MAVPLSDQIEEVEKTVRERELFWLGADGQKVQRGRLLEATARAKTDRMRSAAASLRWLARNMGWIKAEAEARRMRDLDEWQRGAAVQARVAPEPDPPIHADEEPGEGGDDLPDIADPETDEQVMAYAASHPTTSEMHRHFPDAEILSVRELDDDQGQPRAHPSERVPGEAGASESLLLNSRQDGQQ